MGEKRYRLGNRDWREIGEGLLRLGKRTEVRSGVRVREVRRPRGVHSMAFGGRTEVLWGLTRGP